MPAWQSREYKHLLKAEMALVELIEQKESVVQAATALRGIIEQKRIMRGQPAPRPADIPKRGAHKRGQVIDLAPVQIADVVTQPASSEPST